MAPRSTRGFCLEERKPKKPQFLIIAGAVTALFLPFATALPPTLVEKAIAVAVLVALACGLAAIFVHLKRK